MASVRAKRCLCHCEIIYLGSIYIEPSVPRYVFSGWQGGTIAVWATGSREILIIAGRRNCKSEELPTMRAERPRPKTGERAPVS